MKFMKFTPTFLTPQLAVGRMPQSPEDLDALVAAGIDGLLSLQTDTDLAARGLRWSTLWQLLTARSITATRTPIDDVDTRALTRAIPPALAALDALLADHTRVYLHCTLGLYRSQTLAAAHLARTLGVDSAIRAVRAATPDARPDDAALVRWAKRALRAT